MLKKISLICFLSVVMVATVYGQEAGAYSNETAEQKAERMEWFEHARFGMFIHWGAYSILDGSYQGKTQKDPKGEWIMRNLQIPIEEYRDSVVGKFKPVEFDAEKWMDLAKNAGMKYVVMTTKHHDGFALFDSETSDYNIVDATDYNKDIIKELAEASDENDLKFGIYYSQAQDWYHPGGFKPESRWDEAQEGSYQEYFNTIVKGQVSQLFTDYGDISLIWWDSARAVQDEELANRIGKDLVNLQPDIIVNSRLSRSAKGDFNSFEQVIPGVVEQPFNELCLTHNRSWSYRKDDHEWKSPEFVLKTLTHMTSLGSNFLFNVGPDPYGNFPSEAVESLEYIGMWMKDYSESIYGTEASPFYKLDFGEASLKRTDEGYILYLFVYDWNTQQELLIPGLKNNIHKAYDLKNNTEYQVSQMQDGTKLKGLPLKAPHETASVIALEIREELNINPGFLRPNEEGSIQLAPETAIFTTKPQYDCIPVVIKEDNISFIGNWKNCYPHPRFKNTGNKAHWKVEVSKPGNYEVILEYAADLPGNVVTVEANSKLNAELPTTDTMDNFQKLSLGVLKLNEGINTITFTGGKKNELWNEVRVAGFKLIRK